MDIILATFHGNIRIITPFHLKNRKPFALSISETLHLESAFLVKTSRCTLSLSVEFTSLCFKNTFCVTRDTRDTKKLKP